MKHTPIKDQKLEHQYKYFMKCVLAQVQKEYDKAVGVRQRAAENENEIERLIGIRTSAPLKRILKSMKKNWPEEL